MLLDYLFIFIIFIAICIVICIIETKKVILKRKLESRMKNVDESYLKRFKTDIKFDDYPTSFKADNKFDCNAESLRVCDINDPTTLFGCKEFNVRCMQFKEDKKFINSNGEESIIPANKNANEGYALSVRTLVENCNPFHGSLVLVSIAKESNEYMMICRCYREGYIGNDDLLGSCTSVRICKGKIKNINVEFEKIECECEDMYFSSRANLTAAPMCKLLSIKEANDKFNDWSHLVQFEENAKTLPIHRFDKNIVQNLNIKKLLSPCSYSLIDMSFQITNDEAYFDEYANTCRFKGAHIPVKKQLLKESSDQLARNGSSYKDKINCLAMFDAFVHTFEHSKYIVSDHVLGHRQILAVITRTSWLGSELKLRRIAVGTNIGFSKAGIIYPRNELKKYTLAGRCYSRFTEYDCYIEKRECKFNINGLPEKDHAYCCPWGFEKWDKAYEYIGFFVDNGYGVEWRPNYAQQYSILRFYGMMYVSQSDNTGDINGPVSISDSMTWKIYRELNDELK